MTSQSSVFFFNPSSTNEEVENFASLIDINLQQFSAVSQTQPGVFVILSQYSLLVLEVSHGLDTARAA